MTQAFVTRELHQAAQNRIAELEAALGEAKALAKRQLNEIFELEEKACPYFGTDKGVYSDEFGENFRCATIDDKEDAK